MSQVDPMSAVAEAEGVFFVPVDLIDFDERSRMRPINLVWAQALGELIVREQQHTPIDLARVQGGRFRLAGAGGHRLRAHQLHEIPTIKAFIHPANREEEKLREIRDNLHRLDLDPYDRATFVAEAVAVKKRQAGINPAADGRTASAQARWQKAIKDEAKDTNATLAVAYGWSDDVADQLGLSRRTIEYLLTIHRRIPKEQISQLREAKQPIATNATQLKVLAKLDPDSQARTVARLIADPSIKSVTDALALSSGTNRPVGDPRAKRFATIIGTLSRMDTRERLGLLQSPDFHALLPTEAQKLLAPMRRGSGAIDQ